MNKEMTVNGIKYNIIKLLGKGAIPIWQTMEQKNTF